MGAVVVGEPPIAVGEAPPAPVAEAPPAPPPAEAAVAVGTPAAPPKPASGTPIPPGAQVKLVVQRGVKINEEYSIFPGKTFVGRADEKPVDIDLTFQEPEDRVWC